MKKFNTTLISCCIFMLLTVTAHANNRVALLIHNGLNTSLMLEEQTPPRTWEITAHQETTIDLNTFDNYNDDEQAPLSLSAPHILKIAYQNNGQLVPLTQCLPHGINHNAIIQVFNSNTGVECLYTEYQDDTD